MGIRYLSTVLTQGLRLGNSFAFLLLAGGIVFAQSPPLLAVVPLQSLGGLDTAQTSAVTRLLETGLVKSAMFQVLEKNEIAQVLAAQEYSTAECFDESCAIQMGRLLSAKLIVLGSLSRLDNKFFLTAKIIEVATGRTLKAEHEEADTLEAIARRAESLGYRLAGLQPGSHGVDFAQLPPAGLRRWPSEQKQAVPRKQRLLEEKLALQSSLLRETRRARSLRTGSRVLYCVSAAMALAAGTTLAAGLSQDEEAAAASWFRLSLSFAIFGSATAAVGTAVWLEQPALAELRLQIAKLEKQITEEEEK